MPTQPPKLVYRHGRWQPAEHVERIRAGRAICSICGKTRLYPGLQCQRVNADARDRDGKFLRVGEFVCWFHTVREVEGKAAEVAQ